MATNANVSFEDWEAEQMKDPEFRAAVEALEPVYQAELAKLRITYGIGGTCTCRTPNKVYSKSSCESCWTCGNCGLFGGCDNEYWWEG